MPVFAGEGYYKETAEVINKVVQKIEEVRMRLWRNNPAHKIELITYVGSKEYDALQSIDIGDAHRMIDGMFLGCKVVPVRTNSYLEVHQND